MALTSTERSKRLRTRRRHGQLLAAVRIDRMEIRKLVALGYLDAPIAAKGPALDAAVEAYFSDKISD